MDPLLRFFRPTKRCPTGKRQHEKERRNQHPSWDTGHSNIYSGVQKKRWRTYWKYVKLHSITEQWGTLPAENRCLKSAQGPDLLKASGALPFLTLICCIIKQEFTAKDKWGFFFHRRQPPERHYIFTKWFMQLKNHFLTWWCQHLHSMTHPCLSDSDQCLGALQCNVSFENNVPWVSQLARSLAFAQEVWNVISTQPQRDAVVLT